MCQLSARPSSSFPLYAKSHSSNQQLWFDLKVFYFKLSASMLNNLRAPEALTVHCLPRNSNRMALEINGRQIQPSCSAFLTLERSRTDEKSSNEIVYVSTDSVRVAENLGFQVFLRNELLISGTLEKETAPDQAIPMAEEMNENVWSLQCSCKLEYTSNWPFQTLTVPSVDIFLAGRMLGLPLILTQNVQMIPRKKRLRHGSSLDVIHEGNEAENGNLKESSSELDLELDNCSCSDSSSSGYLESSSERNNGRYEFEPEGEEEDSWFNSGLGLGLGLGLGMLGVGLLVNSKGIRKRIL